MKRTTQSGERTRTMDAVRGHDGARIAVEAGMLLFLIGLALLFVAAAPS